GAAIPSGPRIISAGGWRPGNDTITALNTVSTAPGNTPSNTQSAARTTCGQSMLAPASWAAAAAALRGSARKVIPNALTKQAAASAPVSASSAAATGNSRWMTGSADAW